MFKLLFHIVTFVGHIFSSPVFIFQDICGIDQETCENPPPRPFSCQAQYLKIHDAKFKKFPEQTLGYCQHDATFLCTLPITTQSGFLFSTGYIGAAIHWKSSHPVVPLGPELVGVSIFEDASYYNYILLSLGAYTLSMKNWQWSIMCSGLFDPKNIEASYGLYQAVLSGKYQATGKLSLVFGVINETGLHQEKAWPLAGASYRATDKLTVNCIYPINFSIDYHATSVCQLGAAYRLTRFRKKLHKNESIYSQGIFEYQGREIEGNVKLTPWSGSFIKGFYGWSLGKDISIANDHNKNKLIYPFKSSAFFGGSAKITF
ncbi:hypothetical protein [Candidatus Chlamydia sanziniae]|uniref:Uncharacterized protein n=1 Tax=Candidatus Chlamydia sanziniae TaxID=1806891 RepID=A0A1A9HVU1_9CHLA|nr:hypothetical protein [Candidatus Chlamydia sanziniae]ANH78232.1 hypothetical protein Cs308_0056 [Candidatus Chlamydia sanziniae]